MKFASTRNAEHLFSFHHALFTGLAADGGLYVPVSMPTIKDHLHDYWQDFSLTDIANSIMSEFITEIPANDLQIIVNESFNFPIPLIFLEENFYLLELFHGPTLSFKDVGARFMANTMSYFLKRENKRLTILVATSGDTGSAIANAFFNMPNIDVYILYPSEKISLLQEQQMTTLGGNVHALEVRGTFDDCQRLVKTALLDEGLKSSLLMTTANSINIARLLPQIVYHASSVCQLKQQGESDKPILVVPSGNLGNLTASVYAGRMGFPVDFFVAATNINHVFPDYLETGCFAPRESLHSLSNAMDVGNPSNFERLKSLYGDDYRAMSNDIKGFTVSDESTLSEIQHTYEESGYILDPHTAVGVVAAKKMRHKNPAITSPIIINATAHPAKFPNVISHAISIDVDMPQRLRDALNKSKHSLLIDAQFESLKRILLQ